MIAVDVERRSEHYWPRNTPVLVAGMVLGCAFCLDDAVGDFSAAKGINEYPLPVGVHAILAFPTLSTHSPRPDVESMSLVQLIEKKKEVKALLQEFDRWYVRKHQRLPLKSEKEQIRFLYDYYKAIKQRIAFLEAGRNWVVVVSAGSSWIPDTRCPRRSDEYNVIAKANDLAQLLAEKRSLHSALSAYEKNFYMTFGRQVSTFGDAKPMAPKYERYKTIKKIIAILQDSRL